MRLRGDAEGEGLYDVSIHAPGRGATEIDGRSFSVVLFQFTHPGGVRQASRHEFDRLSEVSIHAPGRGATSQELPISIDLRVSIHAPGRGATNTEGGEFVYAKFQFTHPGGVRRYISVAVQF